MRVLYMGDSITDAGRNRNAGSQLSIGQGYPLLTCAQLGLKYPGKFEFINNGISGNRVVDMYARIKADVWNLNPDVLSILIGVNDVWHEFGGLNGVETERFDKVYRMFIDDTLAVLPNIKIMILEPFVLSASATEGNYEEFRGEVEKRAAVSKKIAEDKGLIFIPLQDKFDKAAETVSASYWLADGVHPTPAGHALIAEEWIKAFENSVLK
jgi:lysophospholipase L1-like esterase